MKSTLLICLFLFPQLLQESYSLEDLKWKNRVLLLHVRDTGAELLQKQLQHFAAVYEGMEERDLVIFIQQKSCYQWTPQRNTSLDGVLPKAYHCSTDETFRISLIGKDGGLKLQQNEILNPDALFELIDGMPMRRREMKGRPSTQ